jgi:AraC-like DNA-binding protein
MDFTPGLMSSLHPEQETFFRQMGNAQQMRVLFDQLTHVMFFIKDLGSRFLYLSKPTMLHLGVSDPFEFVGKTDFDYHPPQISNNFIQDDQYVIRTGRPLLNHVEICYNMQHVLDWFVTNKYPVRDESGNIIGVMGYFQSYEGKVKEFVPFTELQPIVNYIRNNLSETISVSHLADLAGISTRQLHRKFQQQFHMSVQQFLLKSRFQSACQQLITSNLSLAEIAVNCGYFDQSAFTNQFRKQAGMTPLQFRKSYRPTYHR